MFEDLAGHWEGDGTNHLQEPFHAILDLDPAAGGNGLSLAFRAIGGDGTIYYRLRGVLAGDRLAFVDNNIGELKILDRVHGPGGYVFAVGDPEDDNSYRLEMTFNLVEPDAMDLCFAWGLPGEEFAPRTCGRLQRTVQRS